MNKKWSKRGSEDNIKDVVLRNTGLTESEFLHPKCGIVAGLENVATEIRNAIAANTSIYVYADYDADGITSVSIMIRLLEHLGARYSAYVPRRFSDGYGLTKKFIDGIDDCLLITIDNGIAQVDEIAYAKSKSIRVVVMDHHLLRDDGILPQADVIVDPSAIPGSDFSSYCGAGLAYKLAQLMCKDELLLKKLNGLAAIGTIADVMPMIGDNRNIVVEGLANLNRGNNCIGLKVLIQELEMESINEGDIGFKLAPIINACGRMRDDGASAAVSLLTTDDFKIARELALFMIQTNEQRKDAVEKSMEISEGIIADNCMYGEKPLVIYTTKSDAYNFCEGIVGIIAGRLAEKYRCPAIVLTETEDGFLKGSARSYGSLNLKELLDKVSDYMLKYGGHAGAAGLSIAKERINEFVYAIQNAILDFNISEDEETEEIFYDLEVSSADIDLMLSELKKYAPYGEGNPCPIFKLNDIRLIPRMGKFHRIMGTEHQHIKLFANGFDVVAFGMAETYQLLGEPLSLEAVGCISENRFKGTVTPQLEVTDMKKSEKAIKKTLLGSSLAEKMKEKGLN